MKKYSIIFLVFLFCISHLESKTYKNIIFDLGGVLINYRAQEIIDDVLPNQSDPELVKIFRLKPARDLARGTISFDDATKQLAEQASLEETIVAELLNGIATHFRPLEKGMSILKQIKEKTSCNIYLLSNMEEHSYKSITHYELFNYADGKIISYQHGCIKPEAQLYEILLSAYNLKAEECLFIDDLQENIDGAQACGIDGIVCDDHDKVKQKLKTLGVL